MSATNEQWSKLSFTGLETALRFAQVSFDGAERLVKLNLDISKQSLEENVKAVRELSGVSDPQEVFNRVSQIANQAFEQAVNNSRNVYEIISCTQAGLTRLAEKNSDVIKKTWATSIEDFTKNTPAGSDVAFDTLKNTIAAPTNALSNFNKVAEQVTVIADAGVKTASTETTEAVETATIETIEAVETAVTETSKAVKVTTTAATEAVKTATIETIEAVETAVTETSEAVKVATTASTEAVKTAATETAKAAKITAKRSGS
ncbi:TIGR01841 family phasin [Crenobacter sp. SG2303]|uniref:TIGR01841 family phasin n=1 Tax=Crenobacter oryzisoli TaxID=3056844 RepID=A0ABT7XVD6_9NEIS|nr:TIGR01841 family phasin [Crenobacter sp. SG2303]MDN0077761.1 TIGR01841 family phasin [Crenobacter sp. SG2303]